LLFLKLIRINDLLNEISGDLRQRVQHIKVVLGEEEEDDLLEAIDASASLGPSGEIAIDENAPLLAASIGNGRVNFTNGKY
jgi:hypothetical protein